ncbi:MAG TPA: LPS export ABC transporter permease LptF [Pseudomonadales bacterium]
MVFFWYLTRQLLSTTIALALVLTTVITTGRFLRYLSDAATGDMAANVLFSVILYRLPGFMDVVLPLSMFLAVLLVYGRMYVDSEMTVVHACGVSPFRIMTFTLMPGLLVMALLAGFTIFVTPYFLAKADRLQNDPKNAWGLSVLVPGKFQRTKTGDKANYTETMSNDHALMQRLFVASRQSNGDGKPTQSITVAQTGRIVQDAETNTRYLELIDGVRYEGWPGQQDFSVARYKTFGQQLDQQKKSERIRISSEGKSTLSLWNSEKSSWDKAALHWRLALPFVIPISILLALPFSKTNPRQGRWLKLIPALLVFILYVMLLIAMRDSIASTRLQGAMPLWNVHLVFLSVALAVMFISHWIERRAQQIMQQGNEAAV